MWVYQILFIGLPLLFVVILSTCGFRMDRPAGTTRVQSFALQTAMWSMFGTAIGMTGAAAIDHCYGHIPGTASDGGYKDGAYYFNWHDETYTPVSKQTWERAWFLEHLAGGVMTGSFLGFGISLLVLKFTKYRFHHGALFPPENSGG